MAKLNKFTSVTILLCVIVSIVCLVYTNDYTYRAYIMYEQYIGDITVNGKTYSDILIMDVELLKNNKGATELFYDDNKYGWYLSCDVDNDNNYHGLIPTGKHTVLYFADEYKTRNDLTNGCVIGTRWTKTLIGQSIIRGISALSGD